MYFSRFLWVKHTVRRVVEVRKSGTPYFFVSIPTTVWPENLTGIKFDEIASKLHNKNMMDFNLTKCAVRRHIV